MEESVLSEMPAAIRRDVHALVEGGGESGDVLLPVVERSLAGLRPGHVLEVVSSHPDALVDLTLWCHRSGQELVALTQRDGSTHIFIRKHEEKQCS